MAIKVVVRTALQLLGAEVAEWIFELILFHMRVHCFRMNLAMTMDCPSASSRPHLSLRLMMTREYEQVSTSKYAARIMRERGSLDRA